MDTTTIPISKEVRDALKRAGRKDETYDDIIRKLLKAGEIKKFYDEMEKILETEEFVSLDKI
jgi:predicted CopG family antitoxin